MRCLANKSGMSGDYTFCQPSALDAAKEGKPLARMKWRSKKRSHTASEAHTRRIRALTHARRATSSGEQKVRICWSTSSGRAMPVVQRSSELFASQQLISSTCGTAHSEGSANARSACSSLSRMSDPCWRFRLADHPPPVHAKLGGPPRATSGSRKERWPPNSLVLTLPRPLLSSCCPAPCSLRYVRVSTIVHSAANGTELRRHSATFRTAT